MWFVTLKVLKGDANLDQLFEVIDLTQFGIDELSDKMTASWISVKCKERILKELDRLKEVRDRITSLEFNLID